MLRELKEYNLQACNILFNHPLTLVFQYSNPPRSCGSRQQRDQERSETFLQRKYQKKPQKCAAIISLDMPSPESFYSFDYVDCDQ